MQSDRLDKEGLIINPKRRGRRIRICLHDARRTHEGKGHFIKVWDLYGRHEDKYEFRQIRGRSEAEDAVWIETVRFPPNEACSRAI